MISKALEKTEIAKESLEKCFKCLASVRTYVLHCQELDDLKEMMEVLHNKIDDVEICLEGGDDDEYDDSDQDIDDEEEEEEFSSQEERKRAKLDDKLEEQVEKFKLTGCVDPIWLRQNFPRVETRGGAFLHSTSNEIGPNHRITFLRPSLKRKCRLCSMRRACRYQFLPGYTHACKQCGVLPMAVEEFFAALEDPGVTMEVLKKLANKIL